MTEDARFMGAALALARRGLGEAWPNPSVGCVIAREGVVVGRGRTARGGRPHAERAALDQAGAAARGATAYVTLEPCAHHGRTPPCAEALIAAGVARVVCASGDPDPRVSGRGFAMLRAAGLRVTEGLRREEGDAVHAGFFSRIRRGRPWVTLKMAATLDGRIAMASGESRWITGPESRARAHLMRVEHDAILVGAATVLADDPALDTRLAGLEGRSPWPILLDARLETPPGARLMKGRPLILHGPQAAPERRAALAAAGAELTEAPLDAEGRLDLTAALRLMGDRGLTRLLCEGGGRLAAGLLAAGLVDEIAWFSAGALIGAEGRPAMGPLGLARLDQAPRWRMTALERCGEDALSLWRPA